MGAPMLRSDRYAWRAFVILISWISFLVHLPDTSLSLYLSPPSCVDFCPSMAVALFRFCIFILLTTLVLSVCACLFAYDFCVACSCHIPPHVCHTCFFFPRSGVVLWQVLTRRQPFEGLTPIQAAFSVARQALRPSLPPAAPPALASLIRRCWHRAPDARPTFSQVCVS